MFETERLILRDWEERDREPFAELGQDPEVMATLGPLMSRAESDTLVDNLIERKRLFGCTFSPVERKEDGRFLGFVGVSRLRITHSLTALPEIGWRLGRESWGKGYASEAARAWLDWVWEALPDGQVVAITSVGNVRSQAVMERLGMRRLPEHDFDHPSVPDGDPLKLHVTYVVDRP